MTEKSYAKINLHLEITGVREDGYHNILSVMSTVSLCDLLKLNSIKLNNQGICKLEISELSGRFANVIQDTPVEKNLIF